MYVNRVISATCSLSIVLIVAALLTCVPQPNAYGQSFVDTFSGQLNTSVWDPFITGNNSNYWPWNMQSSLGLGSSAGSPNSFAIDYDLPSEIATDVGGVPGLQLDAQPGTNATGYTWTGAIMCSYPDPAVYPSPYNTTGVTFSDAYVEVVAQMPQGLDDGGWPAIWFLAAPGSGGGEIDLIEGGYIDQSDPSVPSDQVMATTLHMPGSQTIVGQTLYNTGVDLSAGFHTYSLNYSSGNYLYCYLDNNLVASFTGSNAPTGSYYIILNNSEAGATTLGWHSQIDDNTPALTTMNVSYVGVFVPPAITSLSETSGLAGDAMTIAGTGFTGTTAVDFNGIAAASFNVVSDSSITVTVPSNATSGPVTVTNPKATSNGVTFTYDAPTITSFTPASGLVGASVTVTGTNFTGASALDFNGTAATFNVNSPTSITATVPAGATTGPISVTTPGGTATSTSPFTVYYVPTISSLSEASGLAGDAMTITGTNFTGTTAVDFNGSAAASFAVASNTSITLTVPSNGTSGLVTVTNPAGTSNGVTFTYLAPTIASFTPSSGAAGASVTITGTNLTGATSVSFNGTAAASYIVNSATSITASVPAGATSGPISVTTGGGTATSTASFSESPTIVNLSETTGLAYDVVTITGTNFTGATSVKFGAYAATFTVVSSTSITATVPAVPPSAPVNVTVTTPVGTATSSQTFTYQMPTVTSFAPTSGPVGTSVTITGTGFIGLTSIAFNGKDVVTWTRTGTTQLVTTVPTGATTGKIAVTTGGGTGLSSASFTVTAAPTITSLSETTGLAYDVVTITGTNFTGATSVKFGAYAATFTVSSSTSIAATVPAVPPSAPVKVTVTTPAGTATSSQTFTYKTPTVTSFTPTSGVVGTTVTITGANYIGLTSITFNGKAVVTWTRTGTTQLVTTVPTGATTGKIAVTTGGGTGTSSTSFTVGAAPTITNLSETTGLAYDVVTITGTNFTGATSVKFGAYGATFTVVSSTSITATVPAVPPSSPVKVTVTTPYGTATSSQTFTYQTPTVTSFTPTSGAVGTSVTITGTGFIGLTSIKFNEVAVASWTRSGTTQLTTTVPTGATTGPISVTTGGGTGTSTTSFTVP